MTKLEKIINILLYYNLITEDEIRLATFFKGFRKEAIEMLVFFRTGEDLDDVLRRIISNNTDNMPGGDGFYCRCYNCDQLIDLFDIKNVYFGNHYETFVVCSYDCYYKFLNDYSILPCERCSCHATPPLVDYTDYGFLCKSCLTYVKKLNQ